MRARRATRQARPRRDAATAIKRGQAPTGSAPPLDGAGSRRGAPPVDAGDGAAAGCPGLVPGIMGYGVL